MKRRDFLAGAGFVFAGGATGFFGVGLLEYMSAAPDTPWKTLTAEEAAQIDALAEELIPADEFGGGAHDAKVVRFIDWQLAPGAPYERDRDFYRAHLARNRGRTAAQVEKEDGEFFTLLLAHVRQGFWGRPGGHGGNDGYVSFRLVGVPGPTCSGRNIPGRENAR
ncbi:MAG: gluconate 2-dehydrogenase subunit 3 family protein [Kiritimatiellia bacterium]